MARACVSPTTHMPHLGCLGDFVGWDSPVSAPHSLSLSLSLCLSGEIKDLFVVSQQSLYRWSEFLLFAIYNWALSSWLPLKLLGFSWEKGRERSSLPYSLCEKIFLRPSSVLVLALCLNYQASCQECVVFCVLCQRVISGDSKALYYYFWYHFAILFNVLGLRHCGISGDK